MGFVNSREPFESEFKVAVDNISIIDASFIESHSHAFFLRLFFVKVLTCFSLDFYFLPSRLAGSRPLLLSTGQDAVAELHDLRVVVKLVIREIHGPILISNWGIYN